MDIEMGIDLSKQEYCCALLCIENDKEKFCGDIVMGKVRYCVRHSQKTSIQNQRKKGEKVASRIAHLETRSVKEEDNTQVKCKTKDVDNLVDTDALTNPSLDEVSRIDGRRLKSNKKDVLDSK